MNNVALIKPSLTWLICTETQEVEALLYVWATVQRKNIFHQLWPIFPVERRYMGFIQIQRIFRIASVKCLRINFQGYSWSR